MPVTVSILEYAEIPGARQNGSLMVSGVVQIFGPLIADQTYTITTNQEIPFNSGTKYYTIASHNGTIMAKSSASNATPLPANKGKPIFQNSEATMIREPDHAFVLLREYGA